MSVPSESTFFKFILDPDIQTTGLRIPKRFMRNHGKNLSNRVFLKVPGGGGLWQVEMTTNTKNNEVWLKKGWREFAEHYSIVYKSCLLFTYEGESIFLVIIFDSSASEIEYPTSTEPGIEIEGDDDKSNQRRKKMMRSVCYEELNQNGGSYADTETNTGMNAAESANTEEDSEDEDDKSDFRIKRKRQTSENEMANALRLAKAFKPGNPFFLVRMQPSYVRDRYNNTLPQSFVQRYLNKRHNNVVLQVISKGRTWLAKYMVYACNAKLNAAGWKTFVNDNSLTIGDVCVFELIDGVENLFEVHIFRAMDEKNVGPDLPNEKRKTCHDDTMDSTRCTTDEDSQEEDDKNFWIERKRQPSEIEKANALRLAKAFKPEKPFFLARMQPSYVNGNSGVTVPLHFLQRYMNKRHNNFVLQVISKGRTWLAKYMAYASEARLNAAGWKTFVHDNSLTVGDVCIFELIDRVENLLEVHIFRAMETKTVGPDLRTEKRKTCPVDTVDSTGYKTEEDSQKEDETDTGMNAAKTEENSQDEDGKSDLWIERKRQASENEKANAVRLAKVFKPANPFFLVRMKPSHVRDICRLTLPLSFLQRYLNKRHNNFVLQVISKGRTWLAKYTPYAYNAKISGAGWKTFVNHNSLNVGDVCLFELIDGVENLFEVHIFRAIDEKNVGPDLPNEKRKTCHEDTMDSTRCTTDEDSQEEDDKNFPIERKGQASDIEKAEALQQAKAFKPDNPFFLVTMQSSYVSDLFGVSVQLSFVRRHLNMMRSTCNLQVTSKGRTWLVKYLVCATNAKLDAGWRAFVQDNSLSIDDVCVFELIDDVKNLLKVHIFRAMQNNNVGRDFSIAKQAEAMDSAKAFESENHFFIVLMHPSYVNDGKCDLNIPKNFVETYLNMKHDNCALQLSSGSTTWSLKYRTYPQNIKICGGWRKFARENYLCVGDACVFELIDDVDNVLKVHIFRAR